MWVAGPKFTQHEHNRGVSKSGQPTVGMWVNSKTPIAPAVSMDPGPRFLAYAGLVTGAWSSILSLIVYAFARIIGVPLEVDTDRLPVMVPWIAIVVVPLVAAEAGAMASLLARGLPYARRIVFWSGTALAIASLAFPILRSDQLSTAIWLSIPHVITWFLVVPQIARIIGDTEPGLRVDRPVL
jgi:hypothetical protein